MIKRAIKSESALVIVECAPPRPKVHQFKMKVHQFPVIENYNNFRNSKFFKSNN